MKCVRQARKRRVKVCIRTTASTNAGMSDKYDEERCLVKAIYTAISLLSLDRGWTGAWYSCICPSRAQPKTKTHAGGARLPCSKAMFRATCHVNAKASSVNASSNGSCCIFVYQARVPTVAMKCVRQARKRRVKVCIRTTASTNVEMMEFDPPSNFSYEMGRTWATVQIASQDFFVQTGGVVPPILYLESFCSWFLSNHAFSFCSCICWVSWSIQHKISLAFCHLTEYHLTNCTGSTLDPTKFNHWRLQNVLRIYVGRNFGWQRPNYKMSLGKIMLEIPTFSYFFDFRCIGFCSTGFDLFSEPERVMFFIL